MKIQNAFNDFYNEFKDWTKEEILQRTFDIILESSDKDRQLEAYENMRKEIIEFINLYAGESNNFCLDYHDLMKLRNILNKVGGNDE
jgi:septum formation topological specificity factor MinE